MDRAPLQWLLIESEKRGGLGDWINKGWCGWECFEPGHTHGSFGCLLISGVLTLALFLFLFLFLFPVSFSLSIWVSCHVRAHALGCAAA